MSDSYADQFVAKGGIKFDLSKCPTEVDIFSGKSSARAAIKDNAKAIQPLAHKLYGEANRSVLIVLQGMDTSGKDGTTAAIFHRTPPLNVNVASFKAPSKTPVKAKSLSLIAAIMKTYWSSRFAALPLRKTSSSAMSRSIILKNI